MVIDDEIPIRRLLEITLQSNGYRVVQAATAREGLLKMINHLPDLIILDLGLPDENGQVTLRKMREWCSKPVIILSVQSKEGDIIEALDSGANDYLVKPFHTGELLARIRSALRNDSRKGSDPLLQFKGLEIDLSARTVKVNDELLKLTATQYDLLALFGKNEGKVLTHQYLLREVWGPDYIEQTQYLRVFIAQLRKKIEKKADRPEYILTESGVGYRFVTQSPVSK